MWPTNTFVIWKKQRGKDWEKGADTVGTKIKISLSML